MSKGDAETIARAIFATLESPNESDRNLEAANVVDGLFCIARALHRLADAAEAMTQRTSEKIVADDVCIVVSKKGDPSEPPPSS